MIGRNDISIRLPLADLCAAALVETADSIEIAQDAAALLDALDNNLKLWLLLRQVEAKVGWTVAPSSDAELAVLWSSAPSRDAAGADVAGLISINRRVAEKRANDDSNLTHLRIRIRLAYREGGSGGFIPWLLSQ